MVYVKSPAEPRRSAGENAIGLVCFPSFNLQRFKVA